MEEGCKEQCHDIQDVMLARAQQGILGIRCALHGLEEERDMVHRLLIIVLQVRIYNVITFTVANSVITADIIGLITNNNNYHVGENVLIMCEFAHLQTEVHKGLAVYSCFVLLSPSISYA